MANIDESSFVVNTQQNIDSGISFSGIQPKYIHDEPLCKINEEILPISYLSERPKNYNGLKEFQSVSERIQGKKAIVRGLLISKKGDYSGRIVAGPNPRP